MRYCISCHGIATDRENFCEKCGGETKPFPRCKFCSTEIIHSYCPSCGRAKGSVPTEATDSQQEENKSPGLLRQFLLALIHRLTNNGKEGSVMEAPLNKVPFEILIVDFPKRYGEPLSKTLFGIDDPPPKAFRDYLSLANAIKKRVCEHPELYALPESGQERIIGWAIDGEKVLDFTQPIDTGSFGGTFSASGAASKVKAAKGVVMAWLQRASGSKKEGMFIWPVELVLYQTNQVFAGL
jgi:hypothetical protein